MSEPRAIIETEVETAHGWEFSARVGRDGVESSHRVRLDWSDHDHWSGGCVPPSQVVLALLRVAAAHLEAPPRRFDASTIRRLIPDLDALVRAEIGAEHA